MKLLFHTYQVFDVWCLKVFSQTIQWKHSNWRPTTSTRVSMMNINMGNTFLRVAFLVDANFVPSICLCLALHVSKGTFQEGSCQTSHGCYEDNLMLFLLVGSLQFVVAPYSLAAALMMLGHGRYWSFLFVQEDSIFYNLFGMSYFWNHILLEIIRQPHHPTQSREHILELRMYVMHTFTHCLGHFASAVVIYCLLPSGVPRLDLEINNTCLAKKAWNASPNFRGTF